VRPQRFQLSLAVAGLLVAACGSQAKAPSPTAAPTAAPFTTSAFSVRIPTGWTNETSNQHEIAQLNSNGTVLLLIETSPPGRAIANVNDVKANINVVLARQPVAADQFGQYLASVAASGASNLSVPASFALGGETGMYITYDLDVSGTPGASQDMVVNHDGETYDIVLNTSKFAFPDQLPALHRLLASWRWS